MVVGVEKTISLREKLGLPRPKLMTPEQRRFYGYECAKQFRRNNPDAHRAIGKRFRENNKEKRRQATISWRQKNRDHIEAYARRYRSDPAVKERDRAYAREYARRKRVDPVFRIKAAQRSRVWELVKLGKTARSVSLGLDGGLLREHLERKFETGMTWDNYGKAWHVDHIIPCCEFDLTKPTELRKCFALHNLQPAWAKVNLRKNRRLPVQTELQLVA